MSYLAASPTTNSAGGSSRVATGHTPIDFLPLLTPNFSTRLARTASNASSAAGGSPAAGARGGAANLPPAAAVQQQQLATPSFSSGGFAGGLSSLRSPAERSSSMRQRAPYSLGPAQGSGRRLSAPTGYSESGASDAAGPSFSMQAPSGLSSDDEEGDEEGEGEVDSAAAAAGRHGGAGGGGSRRGRRSGGAAGGAVVLGGVRPLSAAELALAEVTARLERQLRVEAERKVAAFERALLDLEAAEAAALAAAEQQRETQQRQLAAAEAAAAAQRQQQRSQLLSGLRSQHQQKAAEGERKVQQLEAAMKQQAEAAAAQAAAEAARVKAVADAAAAKAAAAAAEQQRQQQAATAAAAAEQAKAAAAKAETAQRKQAAAAAGSGLRIAPSAAEWEKQCAEAFAAAQAAAKPFVDDRAMRDKKRATDKFVTLNVQQISATLEQVRVKAQALVGFMAAQHGAQRTYALLTLANKLVSQCEVQVTRLHSFAFPLAEVAVAVMAAQPDFVPLLVARLHQACPLTVPKYHVYRSGQAGGGGGGGGTGTAADEDGYLRQLGYKITTDEDTGEVSRETTDEFVGRMQGYLMLYAAIMQSDNPQNPHGLQHAWTLLARLLNALPANRVTATAVDAVLKVAGYRMHLTYRSQFTKLLQYIDREFLPALSTSNDPDARAVYTRIQTYLRTGQFNKVPEGRDMPQFDASSYDRA